MMSYKSQNTDVLISRILRTGVASSTAVVLTGLVIIFYHHPDYMYSRLLLPGLIDPGAEYTSRVRAVLYGVSHRRGGAMVMAGLLMLIATPVVRVAVSIGIFARARDRKFVLITSAVLTLLLLSFLIGAGG